MLDPDLGAGPTLQQRPRDLRSCLQEIMNKIGGATKVQQGEHWPVQDGV